MISECYNGLTQREEDREGSVLLRAVFRVITQRTINVFMDAAAARLLLIVLLTESLRLPPSFSNGLIIPEKDQSQAMSC